VAVAIDLDHLDVTRAGALDPLGEALDAGLGLFAGAVATSDAPVPASSAVADRVIRLWRTLGFSANDLARQVVITPACGLASASEDRARAVTTVCREAAKRIADS
jgi:methionine synthase II (cobalamin-independent)